MPAIAQPDRVGQSFTRLRVIVESGAYCGIALCGRAATRRAPCCGKPKRVEKSSAATGRASALFNTGRHVAASLGVATLSSVLASSGGVLGFHAAFAVGAVLGLLGTLSAARLFSPGSSA